MMLTSALLMVNSTAQSQVDVATDTELRVAYCVGVLEHTQAAFNPMAGEPADSRSAKALREGAQSNANRRARLLGYLRARGLFSVRSAAALSGTVAAKRRGWDDSAERLAVVYACIEKCPMGSNSIGACIDDCRETKEKPVWLAIERCANNDPLPY
jgi:hypothetical protein